jgi:cytochrome c
MKVPFSLVTAAALAVVFSGSVQAGPGEDLAAAQKCSKCHTATTTKKAPSWGSIAEKYKGKAEASDKLFTYLKTGGKQSDGDDHKKVEAGDADLKAIVNIVLTSK